ncbi:ABC transporter ATP-binding protein [Thermosipho ferrireducens]|uniref:ABC transporter ATP-binding protein n=1 Tax=Thermosipho ferrireducens TaxID=2571116 RepID=A0ABX7SB70_9BACT|nr:ABC transporter ATP-binding protein [Thermosipho ferrireducens]QTA38748.1 ABC transporter ATP-binding protein [Thermosipho ferrireducens]
MSLSSVVLKTKNLNFSYGTFSVKNINISVKKGSFVGIIGPNGAGKSTILKLISRILKCDDGTIEVFGNDISHISRRKLASYISFVRQEFSPAFEFKVREIVEMGGLHRKRSFFSGYENKNKLEEALGLVELSDFKERYFSTLSGGEQRRVLIARALYQGSPIIIVDELTAHLDISQAIHIAEILKKLTDSGKSVLAAFHNINIAAKYCDYIYGLKDGKLCLEGVPHKVITSENFKLLYNSKVEVIYHPKNNYPVVLY